MRTAFAPNASLLTYYNEDTQRVLGRTADRRALVVEFLVHIRESRAQLLQQYRYAAGLQDAIEHGSTLILEDSE